MSGPAFTLALPGLFSAGKQPDFPRLPTLERVLARADRTAGFPDTPPELLWQLFGRLPGADDVPVAAVTRHGLGAEPNDDCWFCAEPVHLLADRDRLLLMSTESLSAKECDGLLAEFNTLFEGEWRLELRQGRLFLRAPRTLAVHTVATGQALGRSVDEMLPTGQDRLEFHRFLTEVQMLLHQSPVNTERERRGLPTVNSLWPWGGGRLPGPATARFDRVVGHDAFFRGLARLAGLEVGPLSDDTGQTTLAVVDPASPGELDALEGRLKRLSATHRTFDLFPGCGWRFRYTPAATLRFWRRTRTVPTLAEQLCR